jgi:hypothetical protein
MERDSTTPEARIAHTRKQVPGPPVEFIFLDSLLIGGENK